MEDGNSYTVNFTVEKPKPVDSAKTIAVGGAASTKTLWDLFGVHIDRGKLTLLKQKHSREDDDKGQVGPVSGVKGRPLRPP